MPSFLHQNTAPNQTDNSATSLLNFKASITGQPLEKYSNLNTLYGMQDNWSTSDKEPLERSASFHDFNRISIIPLQQACLKPKLKINSPGDVDEQVANRVAEQVMRMPDIEGKGVTLRKKGIQRKYAACEKKGITHSKCATEEEQLRRNEVSGATPELSHADSSQIWSSRKGGSPLPSSSRQFFESRFGLDFGRVRIHANMKSAQLNQKIGARAFTLGRSIFFNNYEYNPDSSEGQELLAHELVHVAQQENLPLSHAPLHNSSHNDNVPVSEDHRTRTEKTLYRLPNVYTVAEPRVMPRLTIERPAELIPNPQGTGLVQTNAQTIEEYLQGMASGGNPVVDRTSGEVSMREAEFCESRGFFGRVGRGIASGFVQGAEIGAYFLGVGAIPGAILGALIGGVAGAFGPDSEAEESSTPTGSTCICDFIRSENSWTIRIDDTDTPLTGDDFVRVNSPNSPRIYGAALESGRLENAPPWLPLAHELCGHAWLDIQDMSEGTEPGERHHRTVERENLIRQEHGLEARGFRLRDPYCGESFSRDRNNPEGSVQWQRRHGESMQEAIREGRLQGNPDATMLERCQEERELYLGDLARQYRVDQRIPE